MSFSRFVALGVLGTIATASPQLGVAEEIEPTHESVESAFGKKDYSPYAGRYYPTRVLFGDTHLHTALSVDGGAAGAKLGPEEAYRFARGEEVKTSTGQLARLSRPLDFLVVSDHSEMFGLMPRLVQGDPSILATETGRRWFDGMRKGGDSVFQTVWEIIATLDDPKAPIDTTQVTRSTWEAFTGR
jgi:hypothetical protein